VKIVQITPGTGGSYCGNCIRDNTLVAEWRRLGHDALLVPMYLPVKVDEPLAGERAPIFFSGINVYLEQRGALLRAMPPWLHRFFARPWLLRLVGRLAAKTRPEEVGELTLSMLHGEHGNQARELDELVAWLKTQPKPDFIVLSNLLLMGLARRLRQGVGAPVICLLAGEDAFLDALPGRTREDAWKLLSEITHDADLYVAPSRYFADVMAARLRLAPERVRVVPLGINPAGFDAEIPTPAALRPPPPAVGFFARMCREKGLDTLVAAFLHLRQRGRVPGLRLKIGGSCGPADRRFVADLRTRLAHAGALEAVDFYANLDRAAKIKFLRSLTVFSVPARTNEAFGLYLLEALAAGVPVVQPRAAAFPEILETSGAGELCEPENPVALAEALEKVLLDAEHRQRLARAARRAVAEFYNARRMATDMLAAFTSLTHAGEVPTRRSVAA
jgi:glycosyltransferase involved in cell wall biosynthesis